MHVCDACKPLCRFWADAQPPSPNYLPHHKTFAALAAAVRAKCWFCHRAWECLGREEQRSVESTGRYTSQSKRSGGGPAIDVAHPSLVSAVPGVFADDGTAECATMALVRSGEDWEQGRWSGCAVVNIVVIAGTSYRDSDRRDVSIVLQPSRGT